MDVSRKKEKIETIYGCNRIKPINEEKRHVLTDYIKIKELCSYNKSKNSLFDKMKQNILTLDHGEHIHKVLCKY